MAPLPWVIKLHVINFFVLLAVFPFSRLVHIITYPLGYLIRPWQIVIWNRRPRGRARLQVRRSLSQGGSMEIKGTPRDGLFGATLGFFIGFAAVALFGPTANKLNDIMHLAPVTVGFLVAMPSLSGSLLRIPFAAWVDTIGRAQTLPGPARHLDRRHGRADLLDVRCATRPASPPGMLPLLFLLGILCGGGIATFSVGTGQVSYWFPRKQQGSALGTYAGVGNLAPGIFSFLLPVALSRAGHAWLLPGLADLPGGRHRALLPARPQRALLPAARRRAAPTNRRAACAAEHGQEIFPSGQDQGQPAALRPHPEDLAAGGDLLHHLRRFPGADLLAAGLLEILLRRPGGHGRGR